MVSYGPWVQMDDTQYVQQAGNQGPTHWYSDNPNRGAQVTTTSSSGWNDIPTKQGVVDSTIQAAMNGEYGSPWTTDPLLSIQVQATQVIATVATRYIVTSPDLSVDASQFTSQGYPPGATGYEWDVPNGTTPEMTPVSAALYYQVAQSNTSNIGIDWNYHVEMHVDTSLAAYGGALLEHLGPVASAGGTEQTVLTGSGNFDVTPYMDTTGHVGIWFGWTDETAKLSQLSPGSNSAHAYLSSNSTITYMLRPPLIRWVYANDTVSSEVAPLRLFPRDDGLAVGTPKAWPRGRSGQASGRRVGGYW